MPGAGLWVGSGNLVDVVGLELPRGLVKGVGLTRLAASHLWGMPAARSGAVLLQEFAGRGAEPPAAAGLAVQERVSTCCGASSSTPLSLYRKEGVRRARWVL